MTWDHFHTGVTHDDAVCPVTAAPKAPHTHPHTPPHTYSALGLLGTYSAPAVSAAKAASSSSPLPLPPRASLWPSGVQLPAAVDTASALHLTAVPHVCVSTSCSKPQSATIRLRSPQFSLLSSFRSWRACSQFHFEALPCCLSWLSQRHFKMSRYNFKIVLLGEGRVGKTSLVLR